MAIRGRKPKPTEKKRLEGNPGKRKLNEQEPKPEVVIPDPPNHLDGPALDEWHRITKELHELRIITVIDRVALVAYCQAWADYIKACEQILEEGEVLISDKGNAYQNPWTGIRTNAMDRLLRISAEFGMTPSSRSRLKVQTASEDDEIKKMLLAASSKKKT